MNGSLIARFTALLAAVLLVPVLFSGQAEAQSRSAEDVLQRLRSTYSSVDAMRASFTQQIGEHAMSGTITLQGDRYRIETADQVLVSDGRTAWAFSRLDNQVLVSDHSDEAAAFAPGAFFTQYPDRFRVSVTGSESIGGTRHDVVQLTPRDADMPVRQVTLYVRSSDSIPTRVRVLDGAGSTMVFSLDQIQRNPRLANDTFRFTAPSGAEVIDLR